MLFNEPKLLKSGHPQCLRHAPNVSVLFNEPKLLKSARRCPLPCLVPRFSALQRAEIAEIVFRPFRAGVYWLGFSALQRAEIAEICEHSRQLFCR